MEEKVTTPQDIIKEGINNDSVKELADNIGMELSDSELDEITEELSKIKSEDGELMKKIIESETRPVEGISEITNLNVDPETGLIAEAPNTLNISDESLEDIINNEGEIEKPRIKEIPKAKIDELGLTEEDIPVIMSIVSRMQNGEKFSVYNELPPQMKRTITQICNSMGCYDNKVIRSFAKDFVDQLIQEIAMDQEYIDLQNTIKETLDFNVLDMWSEHIREKMEVDLIKQADILQEQYPEKAQIMRDVVEAFKDSYTFRRQYELLETSERTRNRLTKDLKRFKRECDFFNFKYNKSKFVINDVTTIVPVLCRKLADTEYTEDDFRKLVMLLCKVSQDLKADNVVDHAFMYYSVSNIIALDYIDIGSANLSEFSKTVMENVKALLAKIKEIEKENESK